QLSRDARAVRIEGMRTALRRAPSRSRAGDSTGGKGAGPAGGSRAGLLYQPVGKVAAMAESARERILTAAKTLAESHDSVQGVTISLESVSLQAGITKPGLMYHFPSTEALMLGLVDHAAEHWSWLLRHHTGRASEELSSFDRHR